MKTTAFIKFGILGLTALSLLAACGSSGGGSTASTQSTGVSKGVVDSLGSITVNGVKFATTNAVIKIDNNPGVESELKAGMVVKVKGTFDDRTGTATEVQIEDALQGPITSIDNTNKTITVMGKVVKFEDNVTRLNDDTPKVFGTTANFTVSQMVEVSGLDDSTGAIRASRIDDRTGLAEVETKGVVSALGASSFTLTSGSAIFTVNFTTALPAGVANGSTVEVRGALAGSTITALNSARGVTIEDALGAENEKVELEGLVASLDLIANTFKLNGMAISYSGSTIFENGIETDLANDAKVEAEGKIVGGVLVAAKISFRSTIRIEALPSVITGAGKAGSLTLLGKTVTTSANTDFHNLANLAAIGSNRVQIRGSLALDGSIVASRIETVGGGHDFVMAPATAKTADTLTLLGDLVTTNAATEYRGMNDAVLTKAAFFDSVSVGPAPAPKTVIKARFGATPLLAEQLEIEGNR